MSKKRSVVIVLLSFSILFSAVILFRHFHPGENSRFQDYTEDLFRQEASSNTITLHFTLKEPEAYKIPDIPASYGLVSTDTNLLCASAENALAVLHSYNREHLNKENQLTYDILEYTFNTSLREAEYALYEEPLAPLTGTQSQLPLLLSEFHFYDTGDCDTYLELLTQTPEYFRSIIAFEQTKSRQGLFMSSRCADSIIEECQTFLRMGTDNYLYSSFEERIRELDLPKEQADSYIDLNRQNIEAYVFPAYEELIDALAALRTTGKNNIGLCGLPKGKEYYELTAAGQTGSSRTIPELQALTVKQMTEDTKAIQDALTQTDIENTALAGMFHSQDNILADPEPAAILSDLESKLSGSFPEPPKVDTQVKYVEKSMEEYLSPAFYMIPAIDNTTDNVIYVNQGHMPDELSLFTTLAHEGYPGHLYQTVYYSATNPDPIRNLTNFGGYIEGWATYSEMLSYYLSPLSKEQATLMQRNSSVILGLYALADMGIHYDGWTLLDTVSFFRSYGITDANTIEEIYDLIIADPGNYLKYYIGYVEFLELKKEAILKWGDEFSQERFHKAVLEAGPAPFDILRRTVLSE